MEIPKINRYEFHIIERNTELQICLLNAALVILAALIMAQKHCADQSHAVMQILHLLAVIPWSGLFVVAQSRLIALLVLRQVIFSIWFPGFLEYLKGQKIQSDCIYLSLGDKEEKTRNSVMVQVGNCIRQAYAWLNEEGIRCILEWNTGGHFKDTDLRTARAFAWVMENLRRGKHKGEDV